ncbi:MAG: type VI secretion system-associated protein TagF [Rhodoferax sp.]|uniref:type VI secretion system-associated protein TagF n=1 Tax=Rhodoferax sp. TaxID=50421 RepID=UPI003267F6B9
MSGTATQTKVGYFGKVPSRGDFIKASDNSGLITLLDNWLAQSMDLLSGDLRWKITYDSVRPLHFVFMGPRSKRAVAGHLCASTDQAQRRFPFLSMSTIDLEDPVGFIKRSPLILARLWTRLESLTTGVLTSNDATAALQNLAAASVDLELNASAYDAAFADFLDLQTVGALDMLLAQSGFKGTVRQLLLALGLLLQPVMASSSSRLEKSLILPLPHDPMYRALVATLWMHLIAPFLQRADFELALFITQLQGKPCMVLGFSGASARTLQAIMDPQIGIEQHIAFDAADWIEEQLDADYSVKKLSSYLSQPNLSLKSAYDSFREAFMGA